MSSTTPEQAEAISRREIDVFCEAGAGTGKTTVLVERFVGAVCDDAMAMTDILAFTFTERAADQLRGRVRGTLRARARKATAAGDADRGLELERLARDTEAAWISTIHGFCRRLLAAHPVAAGVDPRFRVLDEGEASRLRGRAFWAALEALLSAADPETAGRTVAALTPKGLRTIVVTAHDELRSRGREPALPDPPPADPAAALSRLGEAASDALADCSEATGSAAPEMLDRLQRARELEALAASGQVGLDDVIPLELKTTHRDFGGEACERYREAWVAARKALAQAEMTEAYELIRELLGAYAAEYERLKVARSGLDFEDLQLRARDLLRDNEAVRSRYRERFRHLLVDEFQDTNEVQRDLVRLLQGPETRLFCVGDELQSIYGFRHADLAVFRAERSRFRELSDDAGRVLPLTGNFRARAGILGAVNAIGAAMIADYEPLTVGAPEQGAADPPADPAVELMLVASDGENDWSTDEVGLNLEEDEPAPAQRIAEARLLASRLAELHRDQGIPRGEMMVLLRSYTWVDTYERALADAGLDPYVIGGRGYWSQQQVEDMLAILAVIANPLDDEALLGALASPACGVSPDTLWLLRRVALDRRERGYSTRLWQALREVWRDEAPEDAEGRRSAEAIGPEERDRLGRFAERITLLREDAPLLGLEGTVQAAAERLGYDLATLVRERGEARWANVRKLMRLAREFESNDGADLRGFLEYAAEETARAGEGEAPIAAEEHDGVRIMTVHGAKGLEFEVVAVPELGRRILAGFPPPIRIGAAEPAGDEDDAASPLRVGLRLARLGRPTERLYDLEELEERAKSEESAEELRLAHVAFTRAQRKLIMSGTFNPGKDPAKDPVAGSPVIERLLHAFQDPVIGAQLALGESGEVELEVAPPAPRPGLEASFEPGRIAVRLVFPEEGAGAELAPPELAETAEAQPEPARPPLLDLSPAPASSARLSYSALSQYARCGYRFLVERELGLGAAQPPGAGLPLAAALDEGSEDAGDAPSREERFGFGNAIHGLLEWSGRNRWRRPEGERIRRFLTSSGLAAAPDEVERAERVLSGWLESELCERLSEDGVVLRPEEPFLLPMEGAVIRGSIDLLARHPEGWTLVLDYKTDRLDSEPAELIDRYAVQRDIYALAAAGDGAPRTAYVFLERPGEPVELEYGPAELDRAREHVHGLLGGIARGEFEVTRRPHAALCADCPARERLCSHEAAAQLRDDPDPPVDPDAPAEPAAEDGASQLSLLEGS